MEGRSTAHPATPGVTVLLASGGDASVEEQIASSTGQVQLPMVLFGADEARGALSLGRVGRAVEVQPESGSATPCARRQIRLQRRLQCRFQSARGRRRRLRRADRPRCLGPRRVRAQARERGLCGSLAQLVARHVRGGVCIGVSAVSLCAGPAAVGLCRSARGPG